MTLFVSTQSWIFGFDGSSAHCLATTIGFVFPGVSATDHLLRQPASKEAVSLHRFAHILLHASVVT